ncbi:Leucine rich repeat-containing protein [Butyrivibrio sp. YAB3001]|nr:Leucine rich repeat-containing protein [Butyrivibrio sp. YAB3001]
MNAHVIPKAVQKIVEITPMMANEQFYKNNDKRSNNIYVRRSIFVKTRYYFMSIILLFFFLFVMKMDAKASNVIETKTLTNGDSVNTWTMYGDGTLVISGKGKISDLKIEKYKSGIKSIIIEEGLTSIESGVFYDAKAVRKVSISDTVTSIGENAFFHCDSLESVIIPKSVVAIGKNAFCYCKSVKEITILGPLSSISVGAFQNCHCLEKINIPDSVSIINNAAFYRCGSLETINIPDKVKVIGKNAFGHCSKLKNVGISESLVSKLNLDDVFNGSLWAIDKEGTLRGFAGDILYEIDADGVMTLSGNGYLDIESGLSDYSDMVRTMVLSDDLIFDVSYKSSWIKRYFKNLDKIINNSSTLLLLDSGYDNDDYSWCNIKDVTESILVLGKGTAVKVDKKLEAYYTVTFDGNGATSGTMNDVRCMVGKDQDLPENSFKKQGYRFSQWLIYIGNDTYFHSTGTTTINIPKYAFIQYEVDTVKLVAAWEVDTPQCTLTFNGNGATSGSMNDFDIYANAEYELPSNSFVKTGCKFKNWKYDIGGNVYTAYDGDIICISDDMVRSYDVQAITLIAQWEKDYSNYTIVFDGNGATNGKMKNIISAAGTSKTLPKNSFVKQKCRFIGWKYFIGGVSYTVKDASTINIPEKALKRNDIEKIKLIAQWEKDYSKYNITFNGNGATSGKMKNISANADKAKTLPQNTFVKTGYIFKGWKYEIGGTAYAVNDGAAIKVLKGDLKNNDIETLELVAKWAKDPKYGLKKVGTTITDSSSKAKYIVVSANKKNPTVKYAKSTAKNAKSITIPTTIVYEGVTYRVTEIADNAFKGNKVVTTIKMGKNINKIGSEAFMDCACLTSVVVGANVTSIGNNAFNGCASLKALSLPNKASNLGKAFVGNCAKLKTITIKSVTMSKDSISDGAFTGIAKTTTITVPKNKKTAYTKLFQKMGLGEKVKITESK